MNPRYPVYIISKGRWKTPLTARALEKAGVPYRMVIEEQEWDDYAKAVGEERLLILPKKYLEEYDTFDDLGFTKGKERVLLGIFVGSIPCLLAQNVIGLWMIILRHLGELTATFMYKLHLERFLDVQKIL